MASACRADVALDGAGLTGRQNNYLPRAEGRLSPRIKSYAEELRGANGKL